MFSWATEDFIYIGQILEKSHHNDASLFLIHSWSGSLWQHLQVELPRWVYAKMNFAFLTVREYYDILFYRLYITGRFVTQENSFAHLRFNRKVSIRTGILVITWTDSCHKWSSKTSLKSVKFNFQFSGWLHTLFAKLPITTYPIEIDQISKIRKDDSSQNEMK